MNFNKCRIYIPSRGRSNVRMTWLALPMEWRKRTSIVVAKKEFEKYSKRYPSYADIVICPEEGIGNVRQWIIDNTLAKYIIMMDDDLRFAKRIEPGKVKLTPCDQADVGHIVNTIFTYMIDEKYVHASVCKRTEASFFLCDYRTVVRQNNIHGFNVRKLRRLKKKGVRFDRMELMEDFHVTLRLFELGYPNKVLFDYTWDQRGSNYRGGCSSYRTGEAQKRAAKRLARLHPDFVQVVRKKVVGKQSWDGMKERYDVRIAWRKAFKGKPDPHWVLERQQTRKSGQLT